MNKALESPNRQSAKGPAAETEQHHQRAEPARQNAKGRAQWAKHHYRVQKNHIGARAMRSKQRTEPHWPIAKGNVQRAKHCGQGLNRQSPVGRAQWAERMSPESPHRTLHSLEVASCECLRLLKLPVAAGALGPAGPVGAEGHSHNVLGQLQPFDQHCETLQGCSSPASYEH